MSCVSANCTASCFRVTVAGGAALATGAGAFAAASGFAALAALAGSAPADDFGVVFAALTAMPFPRSASLIRGEPIMRERQEQGPVGSATCRCLGS